MRTVLFEYSQLKALFEFEFLLLPESLHFLFERTQLFHGLFDFAGLVEIVAVEFFRLAARIARVSCAARRKQQFVVLMSIEDFEQIAAFVDGLLNGDAEYALLGVGVRENGLLAGLLAVGLIERAQLDLQLVEFAD